MDVASFFKIFSVLCLATVSVFLWKGFPGAPWVPTRKRERELLLTHLSLNEGDIFVDLGCGNGTMLFAVLQKFPKVHVRGYEIFIVPYLLGKWRTLWSYGRAKIFLKNIFSADLRKADVIYCYLLPDMFPKLIKKCGEEMHADAKLIISAWPLPGVVASEIWKAPETMSYYVYTKENLVS